MGKINIYKDRMDWYSRLQQLWNVVKNKVECSFQVCVVTFTSRYLRFLFRDRWRNSFFLTMDNLQWKDQAIILPSATIDILSHYPSLSLLQQKFIISSLSLKQSHLLMPSWHDIVFFQGIQLESYRIIIECQLVFSETDNEWEIVSLLGATLQQQYVKTQKLETITQQHPSEGNSPIIYIIQKHIHNLLDHFSLRISNLEIKIKIGSYRYSLTGRIHYKQNNDNITCQISHVSLYHHTSDGCLSILSANNITFSRTDSNLTGIQVSSPPGHVYRFHSPHVVMYTIPSFPLIEVDMSTKSNSNSQFICHIQSFSFSTPEWQLSCYYVKYHSHASSTVHRITLNHDKTQWNIHNVSYQMEKCHLQIDQIRIMLLHYAIPAMQGTYQELFQWYNNHFVVKENGIISGSVGCSDVVIEARHHKDYVILHAYQVDYECQETEWSLTLEHFELLDRVSTSHWHKMIYTEPIKGQSTLFIKQQQKEAYTHVVIRLPVMEWNIDQHTFNFVKYFCQCNEWLCLEDEIFHLSPWNLHITGFVIHLSYKPRKMKWGRLSKGEWDQILQMGTIHHIKIPLHRIDIQHDKTNGNELRQEVLKRYYEEAILVLPKWLGQIEPFRYMISVPKNVGKLVKHTFRPHKWGEDVSQLATDLLDGTDKAICKIDRWWHNESITESEQHRAHNTLKRPLNTISEWLRGAQNQLNPQSSYQRYNRIGSSLTQF